MKSNETYNIKTPFKIKQKILKILLHVTENILVGIRSSHQKMLEPPTPPKNRCFFATDCWMVKTFHSSIRNIAWHNMK